jgi:hypothetical protein
MSATCDPRILSYDILEYYMGRLMPVFDEFFIFISIQIWKAPLSVLDAQRFDPCRVDCALGSSY